MRGGGREEEDNVRRRGGDEEVARRTRPLEAAQLPLCCFPATCTHRHDDGRDTHTQLAARRTCGVVRADARGDRRDTASVTQHLLALKALSLEGRGTGGPCLVARGPCHWGAGPLGDRALSLEGRCVVARGPCHWGAVKS